MPRPEKASTKMKQKRKSPVLVKILACLLLLASLACLFLPWMKLAVDTNRGRMDMGELLALLGQDKESILVLAGQGLADSGIPMPGQSLRELLTTVLDGAYSLPTLARLCGQAGALAADFGEADAARTMGRVGYGVWGLLGLLLLLGVIALCCVFSDHRDGIVPYLLLAMLTTTGVILLRAGANRYLEEQGTALVDQMGAGMLLGMFGVDLQIVKMSIAAYLCPFLALLALLLTGIRKKQPAAAPREKAVPPTARKTAEAPVAKTAAPAAPKGWTCPNCGSVRDAEEDFCGLCGIERPQAAQPDRCPDCGRLLPGDAAFCPGCGARL